MRHNARQLRSIAAVAAAVALAASPAVSATRTTGVSVTTIAEREAVVGVAYSVGTFIQCHVIAGADTCTTAIVSGKLRTLRHAGSSVVELAELTATTADGRSVPHGAVRVSCSGGTLGGATYPGRVLATARNAPIGEAPLLCHSWLGTLVAEFRIVVSVSIDRMKAPSNADIAVRFTPVVRMDS